MELRRASCRAEAARMGVVRVVSSGDLYAIRKQWQELAKAASQPNPFYAPALFEAALRNFKENRPLMLFLYDQGGRMLGFIPLVERKLYRGIPLWHLGTYSYLHCFLHTPLVRCGREVEFWTELLKWIDGQNRFGFIEIQHIAGDSAVFAALQAILSDTQRRNFASGRHERALLKSPLDFENYLSRELSAQFRSEYRRRLRLLGKHGPIALELVKNRLELDRWLDDFLQIEREGWKGRGGSALSQDRDDRRFFEEIMRESFEEKALMLFSLKAGDKAVAVASFLMSGACAFSFKNAYDETYAKMSPGMILQVEILKHLLGRVGWVDSCADPGHAMYERVFNCRRPIECLTISKRRSGSELLVSALEMTRCLAVAARGLRFSTARQLHRSAAGG